eukprot:TRINITY_DN8621_c0_g1_i1.p1 TRINITY_DN8621_c0_g1~~TRINITY_DN8621_c0_g1_i1.p1  ORF type:complete len:213 (-),score=43.06 TRINITY_DN8621_c0_g1_i1:56-694(-)
MRTFLSLFVLLIAVLALSEAKHCEKFPSQLQQQFSLTLQKQENGVCQPPVLEVGVYYFSYDILVERIDLVVEGVGATIYTDYNTNMEYALFNPNNCSSMKTDEPILPQNFPSMANYQGPFNLGSQKIEYYTYNMSIGNSSAFIAFTLLAGSCLYEGQSIVIPSASESLAYGFWNGVTEVDPILLEIPAVCLESTPSTQLPIRSNFKLKNRFF